MGCFYLLHDNYANNETINGVSFSSIEAPTLAGNIIYNIPRSRPWRTGGHFEVVAGQNTIKFEESTGVVLTATLTVGHYSSRAIFHVEVKAALEAAGASTYTVSADTLTGKIKIVSNGAGGGGIFKLNWTTATDMATLMGFDPSLDLSGALTYTADLLRIHSSEYIRLDMGMPVNPKAFMVIGQRNTRIAISDTAVIKIQGNETDVWTAPSFSQTIPYHQSALMHFNADGFHTEELRYWRFYVEDKDNPNLYMDFAKMYLGDVYAPTRGAVEFPFDSSPLDFSEDITLESGAVYADERQRGQKFDITYGKLTKTEVETLIDIYNRFGKANPIFFIADVDSVFSSEIEYYARLVKFDDDPRYKLESPNNFSMNFSMREDL